MKTIKVFISRVFSLSALKLLSTMQQYLNLFYFWHLTKHQFDFYDISVNATAGWCVKNCSNHGSPFIIIYLTSLKVCQYSYSNIMVGTDNIGSRNMTNDIIIVDSIDDSKDDSSIVSVVFIPPPTMIMVHIRNTLFIESSGWTNIDGSLQSGPPTAFNE